MLAAAPAVASLSLSVGEAVPCFAHGLPARATPSLALRAAMTAPALSLRAAANRRRLPLCDDVGDGRHASAEVATVAQGREPPANVAMTCRPSKCT